MKICIGNELSIVTGDRQLPWLVPPPIPRHRQTNETSTDCLIWIKIVFNPPSYPNLTRFLRFINVPVTNTEMTFSLTRDNGSFEWAGDTIFTLFCQPFNLFKGSMWRMIWDILRFNASARRLIVQAETEAGEGKNSNILYSINLLTRPLFKVILQPRCQSMPTAMATANRAQRPSSYQSVTISRLTDTRIHLGTIISLWGLSSLPQMSAQLYKRSPWLPQFGQRPRANVLQVLIHCMRLSPSNA